MTVKRHGKSQQRTAKQPQASPQNAASSQGEAVRSFVLGQEDVNPSAWLAGLERVGEKLARRMRSVMEPVTQSKVQVEAKGIESQRYDIWREKQDDFLSLSFYRLRPLKGGLLVIIQPDFIASTVDLFYGGTGAPRSDKLKEFTPSEDRLIARLADGIVEQLGEAWSEVVTIAPSLASREVNIAFANLFRPDETVIIQRFWVAPGQGRATTIAIVYSLATLRSMDAQLTAKVHDDAGPADDHWRNRMAYALESVHLPVRSVLARPELTLDQILNLKVGDVIPVSLPGQVPLLVANKRVAMGTIGEKDGHVSLLIEQIEKGAFE